MEVSGLVMNGFQARRWIGRWMISPLRGAGEGWNKECWHRDKYTDHSNRTWLNQQGTEGWHALIAAKQTFLCLCTSVYPMDNYLSFAINCQQTSGGEPGQESTAVDAGVCTLSGNAEAKRTGAVKGEKMPRVTACGCCHHFPGQDF